MMPYSTAVAPRSLAAMTVPTVRLTSDFMRASFRSSRASLLRACS